MTLAALVAVAIENARLFGRVEQLAVTDGLTGLCNHRHFFERLAEEVARAKRYELALSMLMIDIDDFKAYNDALGHPCGDALLRALADVLLSQTRRQVDLVARYGGEEFAVILPSTDPKVGCVPASVCARRSTTALSSGRSPSGRSPPRKPPLRRTAVPVRRAPSASVFGTPWRPRPSAAQRARGSSR